MHEYAQAHFVSDEQMPEVHLFSSDEESVDSSSDDDENDMIGNEEEAQGNLVNIF